MATHNNLIYLYVFIRFTGAADPGAKDHLHIYSDGRVLGADVDQQLPAVHIEIGGNTSEMLNKCITRIEDLKQLAYGRDSLGIFL